jgi:hypothetical protein
LFRWFSIRKKQSDSLSPQILNKLDRIIELLEQQHQPNGTDAKTIHFENVHIERLENITFQLDRIEIDDLSGKLMIGNNITASEELAKQLMEKLDKEKLKEEASPESPSHADPNVTKTEKGYRFRNQF